METNGPGQDFILRRDFLKTVGAAGLLVSLSTKTSFAADEKPQGMSRRKISIFSKHLQWLDYQGMADAASKIGFDGVELTVRPGGHVLPENVERDLPKAIEEVKKAGLEVRSMVVGFNSASGPYAESVLKTAARLGVRFYRLSPISYDPSKAMDANLKHITVQLKALAELNQKHGIRGLYQNHTGSNFGSPVLDLWFVLKEIQSEWLGCQFDIQHATVEGANTWPISLRALSPYIGWVDIKDFYWAKRNGKWSVKNCPMGEGLVDFKAFFDRLGADHAMTPVSMHFEYDLGLPRDRTKITAEDKDRVLGMMKKDLDYLRALI